MFHFNELNVSSGECWGGCFLMSSLVRFQCPFKERNWPLNRYKKEGFFISAWFPLKNMFVMTISTVFFLFKSNENNTRWKKWSAVKLLLRKVKEFEGMAVNTKLTHIKCEKSLKADGIQMEPFSNLFILFDTFLFYLISHTYTYRLTKMRTSEHFELTLIHFYHARRGDQMRAFKIELRTEDLRCVIFDYE